MRTTFNDNKNLNVINFFGGAGCGKSTCAAELFALMKKDNYKVELIHEAAKDYVWEKWSHIFGEQDYIFAQQHRSIRRLVGHDIDYAVVDSPILLSLFYMPDDFPQSFRRFVVDTFNSYNNINIYLKRSEKLPYVQAGRNETFEQAEQIDKQILDWLSVNDMRYHVVLAGNAAALAVKAIVESYQYK